MDEERKETLLADFEKEPFFLPFGDTNWNACLGTQGSERAYYRGYLRSAILLAEDVINNDRFADVDSVVLPILFNARHAVELNLKLLVRTFKDWGLKVPPHKFNHDIDALFECICEIKLGDKELQSLMLKIEPYVRSLSRIDRKGEEFRYHKTRDDQISLSELSIVNLKVISVSLTKLYELTDTLQECLRRISLERREGSHTSALSRRDLKSIANMLPDRDEWRESIFGTLKEKIIEDYKLSNREFSKALDLIQVNRAMMPLIGLECSLISLDDKKVEEILVRRAASGITEPNNMFDRNENRSGNIRAFYQYVSMELSLKDRADLMTIYYMGRDRELSEDYEDAPISGQQSFMKVFFRDFGFLANELSQVDSKLNLLRAK